MSGLEICHLTFFFFTLSFVWYCPLNLFIFSLDVVLLSYLSSSFKIYLFIFILWAHICQNASSCSLPRYHQDSIGFSWMSVCPEITRAKYTKYSWNWANLLVWGNIRNKLFWFCSNLVDSFEKNIAYFLFISYFLLWFRISFREFQQC